MWPFSKTSNSAPLNVAGIIYRMDGSPRVNYMYRSEDDFTKTFEPVAILSKTSIDVIRDLFQKYMNASPHMATDYSAIPDNDKKTLHDILSAYYDHLDQSRKTAAGESIVGINIIKTQKNIQDILVELRKPSTTSVAAAAAAKQEKLTCKTSIAKLKTIPDDKRILMILELLWLFSNPDKISTSEECIWAEKIGELSTMRMSDVLTKLTTDVKKIDTSNGDTRDAGIAIKERVEQLLQIYGISKIMKESEKTTQVAVPVADAPVTETTKQEGGRMSTTLDIALGYAIHPLFDFITSKYDPIYGFLESCFKKSHVKKHKILPHLITLLHISNYFLSSQHRQDKSLSYGMYRIRSVPKDLVQFITSHLTCSASHIEKMSATKQKTFLEILHTIFPIRISSLPKQKSVSPFVVDKEIPTVRFMTLNGNLTIPPFELFYKKGAEFEKEACYQSMTNFFTKDDIYMVYSPSEEIPMNLYEIDYSEIDTSDRTISIKTPVTYFSTHHHTHFQDFATVNEHAIYTNTELALSIFISLKVSTK